MKRRNPQHAFDLIAHSGPQLRDYTIFRNPTPNNY